MTDQEYSTLLVEIVYGHKKLFASDHPEAQELVGHILKPHGVVLRQIKRLNTRMKVASLPSSKTGAK